MIYVYEKEGEEIELEFPMGEAPETWKDYRRVITCPPVHFKGDGWAMKE